MYIEFCSEVKLLKLILYALIMHANNLFKYKNKEDNDNLELFIKHIISKMFIFDCYAPYSVCVFACVVGLQNGPRGRCYRD